MRRLATLLVVAVLGLVVLAVRGPERAAATNYDPTMYGQGPTGASRVLRTNDGGALRTANAPMGPQLPVMYPDGGPEVVAINTSACAFIGAGRSFELTCRTGDCDFRLVAQLADGGWPAFADGGFALPSDTYLPNNTPRLADLPTQLDSVCCFFEAAGTMCASPLYR